MCRADETCRRPRPYGRPRRSLRRRRRQGGRPLPGTGGRRAHPGPLTPLNPIPSQVYRWFGSRFLVPHVPGPPPPLDHIPSQVCCLVATFRHLASLDPPSRHTVNSCYCCTIVVFEPTLYPAIEIKEHGVSSPVSSI